MFRKSIVPGIVCLTLIALASVPLLSAAGGDDPSPGKAATIQPTDTASKAAPVEILPGEIPTIYLLRFLADHTGLPVITDEDMNECPIIVVAAPIHDADADIVIAILEANGFQVVRETVSGDKEVIKVSRAPADVDERLRRIEVQLTVLLGQVKELRSTVREQSGKE